MCVLKEAKKNFMWNKPTDFFIKRYYFIYIMVCGMFRFIPPTNVWCSVHVIKKYCIQHIFASVRSKRYVDITLEANINQKRKILHCNEKHNSKNIYPVISNIFVSLYFVCLNKWNNNRKRERREILFKHFSFFVWVKRIGYGEKDGCITLQE